MDQVNDLGQGEIVFHQLPEGAICFERVPAKKIQVEYVTAGEYARCLIAAIRCQDSICCAHRYLTPRRLVIDEAEYFDGKDETQKELGKLLKQRVSNGKDTVIISSLGIEHLAGAIDDELMPYLTTENT